MYTKVIAEQQVQILSPSFSISPSNEDYVLNISANGRDFSPLFAVSAGVTRLVSNVAPGSYYKLVGNRSEVVINWQRMCATEGGADLSAFWTSAQTKDYVDTAVSGIDLSNYYTKTETDSAITLVEDHIYDVEQVTASALTELHDDILELSANTPDLSAYWTSAQTKDYVDSASTVLQEQIDTMDEVVSEALVDLNERIDELSGGSQSDSTRLLSVEELPASAETGTVMALYQEVEAGGGTWEWDETNEEYVFNCNFSTLDTAATYDLGNPLGSDFAACYSYRNINLHYDNGWKVTTNFRICGNEIDEQDCENQGGTWICSEVDDWCDCSLYRTIELSPSTDPNNGFESEDLCSDYDEDTDEETERWINQRFYWDPADLKLKYVMNDGDIHYRYDCSGVPDLRNITVGTPSEPILGLYQYDGQNWNEVGGADLSAYWTSAQTKDYVDSASTVLQDQIDTMDDVVSAALVDLNDRVDTKVESSSVSTIWKGTTAEYDAIVTKDASTLYIIVNNS